MLALIAGQGRLPVILAGQLADDGVDFQVFEMAGFAFDNPGDLAVRTFRIEQLGSLVEALVAEGFDAVCLAGSVRRPQVDPTLVDAATLPLVPRIKSAIAAGDDGALRLIMSIFSDRGLMIRAAQQIAPQLLPAPGVLSRVQPQKAHLQDAALGWQVLAAQGAADIGQACVISGGRLVAQEAQPGTDAMLAGLSDQTGGFLFKGAKPGQDRRADLATIGPGTVERVAAAGLAGIIIEAGGVLVLDRSQVVAACNNAGLFLLVLRRP